MGNIITEEIDFSLVESGVEEIQEGMNKTKSFYIKGPFLQAEVINGNKRIYPKAVIEKEVIRYQTLIEDKRAVGELCHPQSSEINPERLSHLVTELKMDGNTAHGKAKLLEKFPCGKIAKSLMEEGIKLGISSRGIGTLKNGVVQNDYLMIAQDLVWSPSGPNCFLNGVLEGKEWIYDNGILTEKEIEQTKEQVDQIVVEHKFSLADKQAAFLKLFNEMLQKISKK